MERDNVNWLCLSTIISNHNRDIQYRKNIYYVLILENSLKDNKNIIIQKKKSQSYLYNKNLPKVINSSIIRFLLKMKDEI